MDLRELQQHWDRLGAADPLWAILTREDTRGGKWDQEHFFASGRWEIDEVMKYLAKKAIPKSHHCALDFGCGVGRLTQALCPYFDRVIGVDIAPSMLDLARSHNAYEEKCQFVLNDKENLSIFPNGQFDLVYSNIVLQHMRPEFSTRYVREFVRLLSPGGVALFQMPSEPAPSNRAATIPALPDSALLTRITVNPASLVLNPGEEFQVEVTVENLGDKTWKAGQPIDLQRIRLGNHWLDDAGQVLVNDDVRVDLPVDLHPGASTVLTLVTKAPDEPGRFALDLDMVQENVTWFGARHHTNARVPVFVRAKTNDTATVERQLTHVLVPRMEMYGVRWLDVIQVIVDAGGVLVDMQPDKWAGDSWTGYRYCVMRRQ